MKIYNVEKTEIIENPNLELGHLVEDTLVTHFDYIAPVEEVGHWNTLKTYPNGGKDVEWVVDVAKVEEVLDHDETEDILVYVPYTTDELEEINKDRIRAQREQECFPIINRGSLWYSRLTDEQLAELNDWYDAWLDAPETGVVPPRPTWLE